MYYVSLPEHFHVFMLMRYMYVFAKIMIWPFFLIQEVTWQKALFTNVLTLYDHVIEINVKGLIRVNTWMCIYSGLTICDGTHGACKFQNTHMM